MGVTNACDVIQSSADSEKRDLGVLARDLPQSFIETYLKYCYLVKNETSMLIISVHIFYSSI